MTTTVQVSDDTKRMLEQMKEGSARTYDDIIKGLLVKSNNIPKSMFGAYKDIPKWKKSDRMRMKHE
ncbi:MAG: hypothetical protein ABIA93_05980 [Candidatus Woesearchaeota archaeon]